MPVGNPPFAPLHRKYLLDRAIDPNLAWREGVRSLDEADARRHSGCSNFVGGGLAFSYGRVSVRYARVQLDNREQNEGKTRCPPGVTPPPFIPDSVVMDGDTFPTQDNQPASFALGKPAGPGNLTTGGDNTGGRSGSSLSYPAGVYSDGTRLFVADFQNNRVLVWNTFPTTAGQSADFALGVPAGADNLTGQPGALSGASLSWPV